MRIAVAGSGAWGTALAIRLCENGHNTLLLCRDESRADQIRDSRINPRLPEVTLPEELRIAGDPRALGDREMIVFAAPSYSLRSMCRTTAPYLDRNAVAVSVTKGIEPDTLLRMSQIVEEETGLVTGVLTGPSHAEEVARGIPTGCLAAHPDRAVAEMIQNAFMSETFRIYTGGDIVGAELGGALKNVIALCAGVNDGMGYGDNAKAMLMTRGLTEVARLGVAMGASKETFAGLTGVGDLIVTCTSMHSRNRRAGILIGQGHPVQEAMEMVGAVVEGYYAAKSAWELCQRMQVDMPIIHGAYQLLYENRNAAQVVRDLLLRQRRPESEDVGWR